MDHDRIIDGKGSTRGKNRDYQGCKPLLHPILLVGFLVANYNHNYRCVYLITGKNGFLLSAKFNWHNSGRFPIHLFVLSNHLHTKSHPPGYQNCLFVHVEKVRQNAFKQTWSLGMSCSKPSKLVVAYPNKTHGPWHSCWPPRSEKKNRYLVTAQIRNGSQLRCQNDMFLQLFQSKNPDTLWIQNLHILMLSLGTKG